MSQTSLRQSLLTWFSLLLFCLAIAAATYSYITAKNETSELLDFQQQQLAQFVSDGSPLNAELEGDQDTSYKVEVVFTDGRSAQRLPGQQPFPSTKQTGFSEFSDSSGRWRMYTMVQEKRIVRVAELSDLRDEMARASAVQAVIPFLLALPLSWLLVYGVISQSMGRLTRVAELVSKQSPSKLIPVEQVPDEIRPLVSAMNNALGQAQAATEQQRAFLSDAAHELRTPLAAVTLQIGNLKTVVRDREAVTRLEALEHGVKRASSVANKLLQLAQQESQNATGLREKLVLSEIISEALADIAVIADGKGVDIGIETNDHAVVNGVRRDFVTLLNVILDNAVQYSPPGGKVDIFVQDVGNAALVRVIDTGPGIAEELIPKVFERFYRGEERERPEGGGLGLAIARAISKRYEVRLSISNRTEQTGLIVSLVFPKPQSV